VKKKGDFALANVSAIILILLGLIALILFIYFGRDRMKEYLDVILNLLGI